MYHSIFHRLNMLRNILQSKIFIDKQTINILDICSGPATVPLALGRLKTEKKFKIITIESSNKFNEMIRAFKEVKCEFIEIVEIVKDNFQDGEIKIDKNFCIDWVIIANAISTIGFNRSYNDINIIFNKFISGRLNQGNKNGKILLTIIEGKKEDIFTITE